MTNPIKKHWKKAAIFSALSTTLMASSCQNEATVASQNLKTAAENFELQRDVVFYNAIQGHFFATVKGRCSIEVDSADDQLEVTCKHGEDDIRNHYLGRAAGVTYFVLQTEPAQVSVYNTRVTFNPQGFIPDIDFRGDFGELVNPTRPDTHGQPVPQEVEPIATQEAPVQNGTGAAVPLILDPK